MSLVKRISLHLLTLILTILFFMLLYYLGDWIILNTLSVSRLERSMYLLPIKYSFYDAIGYCSIGYISFLVTRYILKKYNRNYSNHFIAVLSFLFGVLIFLIPIGGFGIPSIFGVKTYFAIGISGYFASKVRQLLFDKFAT